MPGLSSSIFGSEFLGCLVNLGRGICGCKPTSRAAMSGVAVNARMCWG